MTDVDMNRSPEAATSILRREHDVILSVVAVLEVLVSADAEAFDRDALSDCVSFIRLYADQCHHRKEEDLLFPALNRHGLPPDQGPVAVMLYEHEQGRALVREMVDGLAASSVATVVSAGRGYVDLIRDHIAKENSILFEMADNLVVGDECTDLQGCYRAADAGSFEGRSKADLEQMATRLMDS